MAVPLTAFEPLNYALIGAVGLTTTLALAACLYALPWRRPRCGCGGGSPVKVAPAATREFSDFNVLCRGRAMLSLMSAVWMLSQLLCISSIWGVNSFIFSSGVTQWTGAGWMCRIYLTVALGFLQPLCAFMALFMLAAALSRRHRPGALRHPNARLLGLALLCTLPVAAVQAVVAWMGLAVRYQGQPFEARPHSVLGYFFATYWQGSQQQCVSYDSSSGAGIRSSGSSLATSAPAGLEAAGAGSPAVQAGSCTLCVFPAAAVIAHAVFAAALLAALWVTSSRLAAAVLNTRLKRRVRLFQAAYSLLVVMGVAALGASIAWDPFSWPNQACWAIYIASVALTVLLVAWEVVVWPVCDLRAVDKRLALWHDSALPAAAADELESHPSGSGLLIKAHNRSAEAEVFVQAAAAVRTMSVSGAGVLPAAAGGPNMSAGASRAGASPSKTPISSRPATAAAMPLL